MRCWRGGTIPDVAEAVDSPLRATEDVLVSHRLLALVPSAPTHVWGREESGAHDMWNSNSLVAWLLSQSGHRR